MSEVYITSTGSFLPNKAVSNEEIEDYLGRINGRDSRAKSRVLKQNGIKTRHYAIDKNQESTHSNAQLAVSAINDAIQKSGLRSSDVELLCTGTTQGDLPIPGFASMVHAGLDFNRCEVANFQSVCASGIMALKNAYAQIKSDEKENAVCVGSELASRLFKASRFEAQGVDDLPFDAEFLRWMLSDGAGAFVLQNKKNKNGISLKIDWIDLKSHANEFPVCMYTGKTDNKNETEKTWLDYPSYEEASKAGAINLKQDTRLLDKVIKTGVAHYFELIDQGKINRKEIDWLCCHYSSEMFKAPIKELMLKGGGEIADKKWFSNLTSKGNTGSASIFIMLDELMHSGKLVPGNKILCMIPESGRFITSFMQLTVVGDNNTATKRYPLRKIESPELVINKSETSEWLIRNLTQVWIDFETALLKVPIVEKIHDGTLSMSDYKLLLTDLRQQVIDGSQWISRAASNIDIHLFDLRSAFIKHTATEHKDYQMLERNYVALGEDLEAIQKAEKNIGTVALTSFMFQQASKPNPVDLLGSMFIIEGIGKRLAGYWGEMIKDQLNLKDNQVSFFTYHGVADENHFHNLEEALNHPEMNMEVAEKIVKTAKITGKLYTMQLNELGNY
ncbi:3-oxoacyl-[acyl-carrier-protein] synthase III C-terminal domain-containing protein [Zobellia galactanivorans]|uniref:3-oxoacyl-[acyl-carrier-protein] synthase III C-terminal domain-containing protein n=1 Tax=Zobellia galactanivorans (strain DSM 12802 / CCUG 47099 / CIP 106680 / NCIMB 13871 / Dsij) TaxID=63186 RepID=UPI0026E47D84|nr:3-oxoacyl-[acyl-carrier-protein] synthase III C-terminal domain-containing protein [Zobellia galactanivorans]MDO6808959.1 3-oxoacyl-[acyl-carrier-protein] synthase III C-terminal domain-containing protein [Zobellia galactanivorans]